MAERPLSPHIGVYRWAYTMTLSILHRATGIALAVSLIGFVAWLVAASLGADSYATIQPLVSSWTFRVIATLAAIALLYHCCNGVRHLFWDIGKGFERSQARSSAIAVIAVAAVAALVVIYFAFIYQGGGAE